eukprot:COSAG01_NODE_12868_length_1672_cov_3.888112_1_plen_188_part_00
MTEISIRFPFIPPAWCALQAERAQHAAEVQQLQQQLEDARAQLVRTRRCGYAPTDRHRPRPHAHTQGQGNIPRTVSWRRSARTRCVASAGPTGTRQCNPCGVRVPVEIMGSQSELAAMSLRFYSHSHVCDPVITTRTRHVKPSPCCLPSCPACAPTSATVRSDLSAPPRPRHPPPAQPPPPAPHPSR